MKMNKCCAVVLVLTLVPVFVSAQDNGNNFNLIWADPDEITEATDGFVDRPQAFAATNNIGGSLKEFMKVGLAEAMLQFENPPVQFRPLQMTSFISVVALRYSNQDIRELVQASLTGKSITPPGVRQSLREALNELK